MKISNLHDTQYLVYYLKRSRKTVDNYETFTNSLNQIIQEDDIVFIDKVFHLQHINIRPYLFTVHTNTSDAFKSFLTYAHHYLKKAEYGIKDIEALNVFDKTISSPIHHVLEILKHSNLMLVSLLFLMQYYFL